MNFRKCSLIWNFLFLQHGLDALPGYSTFTRFMESSVSDINHNCRGELISHKVVLAVGI